MRKSVRVKGIAILVLFLAASSIWYAVLSEDRNGLLTVSYLNVGEGDAIFIDAPSGREVLIDGGSPGGGVLRRLGSVLPFYDRSIDVVIPTHPDADHIGGLVDVLERYDVGYVLQSDVRGATPLWNTLETTIAADGQKGTKVVTALRGQVVDLGDGAYLEILSPDRSMPAADTNDGCVVARLVYGKTAFMFPCDAPQGVEKYLVALDGKSLRSDVLKAGHHGSRTSSSIQFVGSVSPQYAVYSRGCDNTYGFPHQETVATFARLNIPTLDTCTDGTITFVSDGKTVVRK